MEIDGVLYVCGECRVRMRPDDLVVQTVMTKTLSAVSAETITQRLVGEWFDAVCWGFGVLPFEEIDRGRLADVLERS